MNPQPTTVKRNAQDLRIGDRLWPTERVVTAAPYRSIHCRSGQVRIGIDGRWCIWKARTQVSIYAPAQAEVDQGLQ